MSTALQEVVILNDFGSVTGGSSAVAIASARTLASRGVPVTYLCGIGPVALGLSAHPGVKVICLEQPDIAKDPRRLAGMARGISNRPAIRVVRELLATKDPARTIVHAHTYTKALSAATLAAVSEAGFTLVLTLHDFFISCPTGGLFIHKSQSLCRLKPMSGRCLRCACDRQSYAHKLYRVARTYAQNRVQKLPERVGHFVGVSEHSLRLLRPHLPPGAPMSVIRNPVDCPPTDPAPVASNDEFVFIGRFEREKGVLLFAEAMDKAGLRATFIGDGSLRAEAQKRCPWGDFTGWLPPEKIRTRLARARALVFPPLWYETLGLVVIEAAAAGVPTIVASASAATENVRDEETGLHFAQGSAGDLGRQALRLANDGALAARLGRAAHAWYWSDPWSSERHADQLLSLYDALVRQERVVLPNPIAA